MAKPAKPSLTKQREHARYSRLCKAILVWDMVLPGDVQNPSEATQVEGVEFSILAGVEGQGPSTTEQRAKHAGLVHLLVDAAG